LRKFSSSKDRFLWFVFLSTLAVYVLWFSSQKSESNSSVLPASFFKFKQDKTVQKTEPVPAEPHALDLQQSFARVAETIKPAVVSITAVHVESYEAQPYQFYFGDPFEEFFPEFFGGQRPPPGRRPPPRQFQRRSQGIGSGVIVDPKGYVLTNEHVIRGADELTVTILEPEEKKYTGKVVGADPRTDLAVVKITPKGPLTFAALGDSKNVRVGDWAIAVGSPFGLEQTVTVGVISAVRQSLNIEGHAYTNLLQTDAAINRGNSGGPLVNIKGEVIGINTAIYAPTGVFAGIGFAIPVNNAKEIMAQLIEKGRVVRGWMGVEIRPLDDILARQFGVSDTNGVIVNNVLPDSPAEKAGLRRGDVIREFNGQKITTQESLVDIVSRTPPKTKTRVGILREGRAMELTLLTGELPAQAQEGKEEEPAPAEEPKTQEWGGARVAAATSALARRYNLPPDKDGVVFLEVAPGETADKMGLMEGDFVVSVNQQKTSDVKSFLSAVKKADTREGLVMDVFRQGRWFYLSYKEAE
jgi:serine protease Do